MMGKIFGVGWGLTADFFASLRNDNQKARAEGKNNGKSNDNDNDKSNGSNNSNSNSKMRGFFDCAIHDKAVNGSAQNDGVGG
jgi:hypothetical protein